LEEEEKEEEFPVQNRFQILAGSKVPVPNCFQTFTSSTISVPELELEPTGFGTGTPKSLTTKH